MNQVSQQYLENINILFSFEYQFHRYLQMENANESIKTEKISRYRDTDFNKIYMYYQNWLQDHRLFWIFWTINHWKKNDCILVYVVINLG